MTIVAGLLAVVPCIKRSVIRCVCNDFGVKGTALAEFCTLRCVLPVVVTTLTLTRLVALRGRKKSGPLNVGATEDLSCVRFRPCCAMGSLLKFFVFKVLFVLVVFFCPGLLKRASGCVPTGPLIAPARVAPRFCLLFCCVKLETVPGGAFKMLVLLDFVLILTLVPFLRGKVVGATGFEPLCEFFVFVFFVGFLVNACLNTTVITRPCVFLDELSAFCCLFFVLVLVPILSFLRAFFFVLVASGLLPSVSPCGRDSLWSVGDG